MYVLQEGKIAKKYSLNRLLNYKNYSLLLVNKIEFWNVYTHSIVLLVVRIRNVLNIITSNFV